VSALPAASQTVADFIDAMRAARKRPATIRRYVSSIAHLHRAAELPVPSDSNTVKLALRRAWFKTGGLWVTPKVTGAAPTKAFHVSRVTRI
jgi:acetylornithine deacetylase/succinyl-diaminopimelate desuccinylase-like protein